MVDLSTNTDNYVKYKWSTFTNQKTGIGSEFKKKQTNSNNILFTRKPVQIQ